MECWICGHEVLDHVEKSSCGGKVVHAYCGQVNSDYARGSSKMHIVYKDGSVRIPSVYIPGDTPSGAGGYDTE